MGYSKNAGCAEIALALAPVFIADQLDTGTLNDLTLRQVYSIWFEDSCLFYNEEAADITISSDASYQKKQAK